MEAPTAEITAIQSCACESQEPESNVFIPLDVLSSISDCLNSPMEMTSFNDLSVLTLGFSQGSM